MESRAGAWSCVACGAACPDVHRFCGHCGSARAGRGSATTAAALTADGGELVDVLRSFVSHQLVDRLVDEGGRIPEQRRLVTALFADLSGFTTLAGQLEAEEVAAIVDPMLDALVRVVHHHEGYVGSFAGDALLAFYGAPVAHEDDADRALRSALAMLAEFPALRDAAGPAAQALSLRIGVNTGHVLARLMAGDIRTDYSVLGDAVNMAQRLQSIAPKAACWVGEQTWRLTHTSFDLEPMGEFTVKGKSEPIAAWALRGEKSVVVHRWRASGARFVGRQRELAQLRESLTRPGFVVLRGEAGAGKSRLLDEVRADVTDARWVLGGAAPYDRATSYRPWAAVVRELLGDEPDVNALDGFDEQERDGLRVVLGRPSELPELTSTAEARRRTVALGTTALLRSVAPVRVVLEDLHWADDATLQLAEDVVRDNAADDVVLVASTRPDATASASILEAAGDRSAVVEVAPLGVDDVAALLADVLGGTPPPGLPDEVQRRSGGNPLFAAELARALLDRGFVRRLESGTLAMGRDLSDLGDAVPDTLEGLLGARVDALPTAAARALTIAAVVGEPLRPDLIDLVAQRSDGGTGARAALDTVVAEGLLVPAGDGQLGFVHALVADAVYARTSRRRRRELHRTIAEVAPEIGLDDDDNAGFLARHLYLGGAGHRAVQALARAADLATQRSALAEAVVHLTREVELRRDHPADRALLPDRLVLLGEHLETLARYVDAEPVLREAVDLGAGWRAERALAGVLRRQGRYDDAIGVCAESLARIDDDEGIARLQKERGWALMETGDADGALAAAESGLEHPASATATAGLRLLRGHCLARAGRADESGAAAEEAARAFESIGDLAGYAAARRLYGRACRASGRAEDAAVALADGLQSAERAGAAEEVAACLNNLAMLYGERGEFELTLELEQRAIENADRMGHRFGQINTRCNHAFTLLSAGRTAEAAELARDVITRAEDAGLKTVQGYAMHTLAGCLMADGNFRGAAVTAEEAARLLASAQFLLDARDYWRVAAEAWERAGEPHAAARARKQMRDLETQVPAQPLLDGHSASGGS